MKRNIFYFLDRRVNVSCTDNYIRVQLDKKYFDSSKYGSISLRNSSCRAFIASNKITLGSSPNACGTTITETAHQILFENVIVLKAKLTGSEMISREHDQSISIRCVYKRSDIVGVSFDPVMDYKGYEGSAPKIIVFNILWRPVTIYYEVFIGY